MKHILVTGGAGFIGSHLVEALCAQGMKVTVLDNLQAGKIENLKPCANRIDFVKGDIRHRKLVEKTARKQDIIFHIAANASVPYSVKYPEYDFTTNTIGTYYLLRAALQHKVKKFIFASTAGVYGETAYAPIDENHPVHPISPYGASKLAAEKLGCAYAQCYGLPFISARIFNTFGPRLPRYVIFDFLMKLKKKPRCLKVLGDGHQIREFAYVKDTVSALLLLAAKDIQAGEIFNVAGRHVMTIKKLAYIMLQALCLKQTKMLFTGKSWPGDVKKTVGNIAKIKAIGFTPRYSFEDGLRETIAWFEKTYGKIKHC